MRYTRETIDNVREASDIVATIGQYVSLERRGSGYVGLCPFHNEKTPSFHVNPSRQIYHCFGCGEGGDVFRFLMNYENLSFQEAVVLLAKNAGIDLPEPAEADSYRAGGDEARKNQLYAVHKDAAFYYHSVLKSEEGARFLDYFRNKRRLSDSTITHFGLGATPRAPDGLYRYLKSRNYSDEIISLSGLAVFSETGTRDRFYGRALFPIMDMNSRVIGFGGRVIDDREPKYLNSPESLIFDKSSVLYGLNFARKSKKRELILVEGYLDVISLNQSGFSMTAAALGTALTVKHARLIKRYFDRVVLALDFDEAGLRAKQRAYPILHDAGLDVVALSLKNAKDPDEFVTKFGRSAFQSLVDNAENGFLYLTDRIKEGYDLSDPAMKTRFFDEIASMLAVFSEPLERNNYLEACSLRYFVPPDRLSALVETKLQGRFRPENRQDSKTVPPGEAGPEEEKDPAYISPMEEHLITCLIERPAYIDRVREILPVSEFSSHFASELYEYALKGKVSDEAALFLKFEGDETKERIFTEILMKAEKEKDSERSLQDFEKGLNEALRAVRKKYLEKEMAGTGNDMKKFSVLAKQKNDLRRLSVHIDDEAFKET